MNGLIPALIAVLLAEIGPRSGALLLESHRMTIVFVVAAVLSASAVAGALVAPQLAPNAETLLIALALAFAAWAQLGRVKPATTMRAVLSAFWGGGTSLLVFALATRFAPLSVGIGAALGLGASAAFGLAVRSSDVATRLIRRACALILLGSAAILAVIALRLV